MHAEHISCLHVAGHSHDQEGSDMRPRSFIQCVYVGQRQKPDLKASMSPTSFMLFIKAGASRAVKTAELSCTLARHPRQVRSGHR